MSKENVLRMVAVLGAVVGGWVLLAAVAYFVRQHSYGEDVTLAMQWAKELLGLAGTVAGFLGLSAGAAVASTTSGLEIKAAAVAAGVKLGGLGLLGGIALLALP